LFFFQAEDGIRDFHVTGVQTCALPISDFTDLVVGGHDISAVTMAKRAEHLVETGMIPPRLLAATHDALEQADAEVRPGYAPDHEDAVSQQQVAERLAADIASFRDRNGLARVVVVDLSSTEPPVAPLPEHDDPAALLAGLADPDRAVLPASSVSAYAAVLAGAAYACFTPSAGMGLPAL